ncbi:MAG TPA: hypothetical protein VGY99_10665 [Candidatus Binataceae bacterium]|jgi:hypothetical protein|nr:hypothetical protein [Candidatus Binataceae bacterium]
MARINVGRVIVGGIIAGVICFFGDGIVHGVLLKDRWAGIMTALGKSSADVGRQHPGYFLAYDLLKGVLAVWLYAAMRPRFGPGPATALLAAITIWLLVIPTPIIGLLPMEFFSAKFAVLWSLYGLVPIIIGALIGAWIYREAA